MLVTVSDLTVSYGRHPAIHHLSGSFASGSFTAIAGPNGAGKSTLLKALAGILKTSTGVITYDNSLRDKIAYMPQTNDINRDFPLTVMQLITTGYWQQSKAFGGIKRQHHDAAKYALAQVGLAEFENRPISTLSSGQFQRMLFARVILQDAQLILLDEPLSAIDAETSLRLIDIMKEWHRQKRTIICVLHDLEMIRQHFPECLLLARKAISWGPAKDVLSSNNLFNAKLFHEAWQDNAEICQV